MSAAMDKKCDVPGCGGYPPSTEPAICVAKGCGKKVHIACSAYSGHGDEEVFCSFTCAMVESARRDVRPTELIPSSQHEQFLTEMVAGQIEKGYSMPFSPESSQEPTLRLTLSELLDEAEEGDRMLTHLMAPPHVNYGNSVNESKAPNNEMEIQEGQRPSLEVKKRKESEYMTVKRELLGRTVQKDHLTSTIRMKVIKVIRKKEAAGFTKAGIAKYVNTYFCDLQSYDGNNVFSKNVPVAQVRAMLLPEMVRPEIDMQSIPDAPRRKKSKYPISAQIEEEEQGRNELTEDIEQLKPLITKTKTMKRAHEGTGYDTPPFLSPRGIIRHHEKELHKDEEAEQYVFGEDDDEDEGANGYTEFPTFEFSSEFAQTDGVPSAGLVFRDHRLEAEDECTAGTDLLDKANLVEEVKSMTWQDCQFGEVVDDPRHIEMKNPNWNVATKVVKQTTAFGIFQNVFPKKLWTKIARYTEQNRIMRCKDIDPTRKDSKHHFDKITTKDVVTFCALLLLNMLHGYKEGLEAQWTEIGTSVHPPGRFGAWMSRDKFRVVARYLIFHDVTAPIDDNDRHYRLRTVIEDLNESYRSCYNLGKYISFDEATFACVSKYLPSRIFNPMKPHRYGLKIFMTCCAVTGYCFKFDVYQGSKNSSEDIEKKSGPQALFRAMEEFEGSYRVVICDRFYTSVLVFLQLLKIGLFAIGTIITDRKGFPQFCKIAKDQVRNVKRGHLQMGVGNVADVEGDFLALGWMDSKPVHLLATGSANYAVKIRRRVKDQKHEFAIPVALSRYHRYMGGVDQNDFMRMSRYSVQQSYHARKWFKSIFLSMFDLSVTNAYILHHSVHKEGTALFKSREQFMYSLVDGMLNFLDADETVLRRIVPDVIEDEEAALFDAPEHELCEIQSGFNKPRNVIRTRRVTPSIPIMYGHTGRDNKYKDCVVCRSMGMTNRTKFYCNHCQRAVCSKETVRVHPKHKTRHFCWNVLHLNHSHVAKAEKMRTKRGLSM